MLFFTEDCAMESECSDSSWINNGIEHLEKNRRFIAVRPYDSDLDDLWYKDMNQFERFREAYMFTDRMFLAEVKRLKSIDYNCQSSYNYPAYGEYGFEARVYNYMRANDLRMLVSQDAQYIHESVFYLK